MVTSNPVILASAKTQSIKANKHLYFSITSSAIYCSVWTPSYLRVSAWYYRGLSPTSTIWRQVSWYSHFTCQIMEANRSESQEEQSSSRSKYKQELSAILGHSPTVRVVIFTKSSRLVYGSPVRCHLTCSLHWTNAQFMAAGLSVCWRNQPLDTFHIPLHKGSLEDKQKSRCPQILYCWLGAWSVWEVPGKQRYLIITKESICRRVHL